jgi:hypothetical protein
MGLQLFSQMKLTAPNTWVGNVYNPEEGRVYTDVKVTMISRQQIVLRGCRTWLLCGEKTWTRTKLAPAPAEPVEEPIEVKAPAAPEPPATRDEEIEANAMPQPEARPVETARETVPAPAPEMIAKAPPAFERAVPAATSEPRVSEAPKRTLTKASPSYRHTPIGFGFSLATSSQEALPLSGDNVSSMIVMTRPSPLAPGAAAPQPHAATPRPVETALQEDDDLPVPVAKPKPKPKPRAQAAQAAAVPVAVAPAAKPKPKPKPVAREPQEKLPWLQ